MKHPEETWLYYIWQVVTWWMWRRWHIHCPSDPIPSVEPPPFQASLLDYDEHFVCPCTLNPENNGAVRGKWTPKVGLIGLEHDDRFINE